MDSESRGWLLIAGSVIAAIGIFIPGDYGVNYSPPRGNPSLYAIHLDNLAHFRGSLTTAYTAVYSLHGGPLDFHWVLIGVICLFALGLLSRGGMSIDRVKSLPAQIIHHSVGAFSMIATIGSFMWNFRYGRTPPSIPARFVADLGHSELAVHASHYVTANLGFGTLIIFFGLLLAYAGFSPKVGCALFLLMTALFFGLFIYANV